MRLSLVIDELMKKDLVNVIDEEVNSLEITTITRSYKGEKVLLFTRVKGTDMPIVTNLIGSRRVLKEFFNAKNDHEVYMKLMKACEMPIKCKEIPFKSSSFTRRIGADLGRLPQLVYYPEDPGPYITSGVLIAKGVKSGICNASIHRLLILGKERMTIRIVPRHLWQLYKEAVNEGRTLPVAIIIGTHPLILIAASSSPPFGVYEVEVANALMNNKLEITKSPNYKIPIPAHGEILIEGEITAEEEDEGPFVDLTGTYDIVRKQPVIRVRDIWTSEKPMYHAIVPASREHMLLMGLYREALIWDYVRKVVPKVKKVRLTEGGCGWLHAAISISKTTQGDGKNAILAAFAAHPSLKFVVVVDDDIDVDDPYQIEWAIATRFQASRDLVIIRNARGSSLDPSCDQEMLITDKMGIDATIDLTKPRDKFMKVRLMTNNKVKQILKKLK